MRTDLTEEVTSDARETRRGGEYDSGGELECWGEDKENRGDGMA